MTSRLAVMALCCLGALASGPADWVPARWEGGPAELARRVKDKSLSSDPSARDAVLRWYEPETLGLLEGTPINCLLLTLGGGAPLEVAQEQQKLVKNYARLARARGLAVLGVIRPGADPAAVAALAAGAQLDGIVLEGEFPAAFAERVRSGLESKRSAALIISIAAEPAPVRTSGAPLLAVEGVQPSSRHPMEDGIRATPTTEPWIESNMWRVRSFRLGTKSRPIWISHGPKAASRAYYAKSVADAAAAGGRWVVTLADDLRAKLFLKDPEALASWRDIAAYLRFAEEHADWRNWAPYGNVGIILDTAGKYPDVSDEYLNLVARRQVPYRVIERSQLNPAALEAFHAVLAADLAPPTEAERKMLSAFAENGGVVVAGASWGNGPKNDPFAELRQGKGRVVIYKDDPPEPDAVARGLTEFLEPEVIGLTTFNVPSVLTYASTSDRRVLVQLVNYADRPFDARITLRVNGSFKNARQYRPEGPPADLAMQPAENGRTQVAIPKLGMWGAVLFE